MSSVVVVVVVSSYVRVVHWICADLGGLRALWSYIIQAADVWRSPLLPTLFLLAISQLLGSLLVCIGLGFLES